MDEISLRSGAATSEVFNMGGFTANNKNDPFVKFLFCCMFNSLWEAILSQN